VIPAQDLSVCHVSSSFLYVSIRCQKSLYCEVFDVYQYRPQQRLLYLSNAGTVSFCMLLIHSLHSDCVPEPQNAIARNAVVMAGHPCEITTFWSAHAIAISGARRFSIAVYTAVM
jgi:hypothetical protein